MKAKFFLFSALCLIIFSSCTITVDFEDETGTFSAYVSAYSPYVTDGSYGSNQSNITNCPSPIAKSAFEYAKLYAASDTVYKLGAQDPLRSIQIDCSGLIIMCYKYALKNTGYSLVQSDMSSSYMYEHASIRTTTPRRGDLIFMGDSNSSKITHVAIFDRFEGDQVYFIDSTSVGRTTGVSERHYSRNDKRIKSYGIMKLKY